MIFQTCISRIFISTLILSLIPISGCTGEIHRHWSEDVEVENGTVVTIDRYVQFVESNSMAGDAYSTRIIRSTLSIRDDLAALPKWDFPLEPLVLYRDEVANEWVVVATTNSCDEWAALGSPFSPYWEFRRKNDKWVRAELSASSKGRKPNLFFAYEESAPASHMSRQLKEKATKGKDFGETYRSIDAETKANCTPQAN